MTDGLEMDDRRGERARAGIGAQAAMPGQRRFHSAPVAAAMAAMLLRAAECIVTGKRAAGRCMQCARARRMQCDAAAPLQHEAPRAADLFGQRASRGCVQAQQRSEAGAPAPQQQCQRRAGEHTAGQPNRHASASSEGCCRSLMNCT